MTARTISGAWKFCAVSVSIPVNWPCSCMDTYIFVLQGSKVEDLTDRLAKHERESIDALAEAAGVEAKLIAVTHE